MSVCSHLVGGGGTPSKVSVRGYPIPGLGRRCPVPGLDGGGYPIPGLGGTLSQVRGGTPSQIWVGVPHPRSGGYSIPYLDGGYSIPGLNWGYPIPGLDEGYLILLMGGTWHGVPLLSRSQVRMGVPPSPKWGTPHQQDGVSPAIPVRTGGYPNWNSMACTCYVAGGMPLAFMPISQQEGVPQPSQYGVPPSGLVGGTPP